jgi:hypothetical protein
MGVVCYGRSHWNFKVAVTGERVGGHRTFFKEGAPGDRQSAVEEGHDQPVVEKGVALSYFDVVFNSVALERLSEVLFMVPSLFCSLLRKTVAFSNLNLF